MVASTIAMSLPGGSKLLPFLSSMIGAYPTPTPAAPLQVIPPESQTPAEETVPPGPVLRLVTHAMPFLHNYPHWLEQYRVMQHAVLANLGTCSSMPTGHLRSSSEHGTTTSKHAGDTSSAKGALHGSTQPLCPPIGSVGTQPALLDGAQPFGAASWGAEAYAIATEDVHGSRVTRLSDRWKSHDLAAGTAVLVPVSAAETDIAEVVNDLLEMGGAPVLAQSSVRKALSGAFGRLEHRASLAFLQLRMVSFLLLHSPRAIAAVLQC
jgi:hypothetical protein